MYWQHADLRVVGVAGLRASANLLRPHPVTLHWGVMCSKVKEQQQEQEAFLFISNSKTNKNILHWMLHISEMNLCRHPRVKRLFKSKHNYSVGRKLLRDSVLVSSLATRACWSVHTLCRAAEGVCRNGDCSKKATNWWRLETFWSLGLQNGTIFIHKYKVQFCSTFSSATDMTVRHSLKYYLN